MIKASRLREVLDYDPSTGLFHWKVAVGRRVKAGDVAGSLHIGHRGKRYWRIAVDGERHLAHRLVWLHVHGVPPDAEIDHINGDGTDNRLFNLRLATHGQNRQNAAVNLNNTSGVKGVSYNVGKGKWQADIHAEGRSRYLGTFDSFDAAVEARRAAELELHGEFRRTA